MDRIINSVDKKDKVYSFDYNHFSLAALYVIVMAASIIFPWIIERLAGSSIGFLDNYEKMMNISDVSHYIDIAANGYVTSGEEKLFIVFFPFYPMVIRIVHDLLNTDYYTAASVVSFLAGLFSAQVLYKLALIDYDEKTSYCIAKYYLLFPFTFFIFTRMSEALFLLLLFSTILFIRKENYLFAGIFGFMTAFTRLPGLAVGVVMLVEAIIVIYKNIKNKNIDILRWIDMFLMMCLTLSGFISYLMINNKLYGNPLKFLDYQKEHWNQSFTNPIYVIKETLFEDLIKGPFSLNVRIGCGVSGLIAIAFILAAIFLGARLQVRTSYIVYMLIYFYVCYSAAWLLSGARYSLGAFVIFIVAGKLSSKYRFMDSMLSVGMVSMMLLFSYVCSSGGMY